MMEARAQTATPPPAPTRGAVAGALFLGGGLKSAGLIRTLGRPALCLPQRPDARALDVWLDAFEDIGLEASRVRILTDASGAALWSRSERDGDFLVPQVIEDKSEYRGPAGVLHDASEAMEADGSLVIVEHSRLLGSPSLVAPLLESHRARENAISVATNPDGSFAGVLIAERETIEIIPSIGFMDIKEQWIPAVQAAGHAVGRVPLGGWSHAIRSLEGYLDAVAQVGGFGAPSGLRVVGRDGARLTPTRYEGSLVADSARIEGGVAAARSVICAGATVGENAVVVRSVVGPGARVPKEGVVIDSVVAASDVGGSGE